MSTRTFLIITGHDPRTKRRANIHFIADELSKRGTTRVFSVGFSRFSRFIGRDIRVGLSPVNTQVIVNGVRAFLWKSLFHPFKLPLGDKLLSPLIFGFYILLAPRQLKKWALQSEVIMVESGLPVVFIRKIRRWAPMSNIIYIGSDDPSTIGCSSFIIQKTLSLDGLIDAGRLASPLLINSLSPATNSFFVPHGMDVEKWSIPMKSPYAENSVFNAVSVGSMLFDPEFFRLAAPRFPDVVFHVIGSGYTPDRSDIFPNLVYYSEMEFDATLAYIKFADFGVAPYRDAKNVYYLADTSMKLRQFDFAGVPSVCPSFAAGSRYPLRIGYTPDDAHSIVQAVDEARSVARSSIKLAPTVLSWSDVVARILDPSHFEDTVIVDDKQ